MKQTLSPGIKFWELFSRTCSRGSSSKGMYKINALPVEQMIYIARQHNTLEGSWPDKVHTMGWFPFWVMQQVSFFLDNLGFFSAYFIFSCFCVLSLLFFHFIFFLIYFYYFLLFLFPLFLFFLFYSHLKISITHDILNCKCTLFNMRWPFLTHNLLFW